MSENKRVDITKKKIKEVLRILTCKLTYYVIPNFCRFKLIRYLEKRSK